MAEEIQKRNVAGIAKESYNNGVVLGVQGGKAVTYGVNEEGGLVTTDKVNENLTFGEVKEGDINVVSGNSVNSIFEIKKGNILEIAQMINAYVNISTKQLSYNKDWLSFAINVTDLDTIFINGWCTSRREVALCSIQILDTTSITDINNNITNAIQVNKDKCNSIINTNGSKSLIFTVKNNNEQVAVYENLKVSNNSNIIENSVVKILGNKISSNYAISSNGDIKSFDFLFEEKSTILKYTKGKELATIEKGIFKQDLRVNRALNMPFDVGNVYKNGVRIAVKSDESAPYRMDGQTIGGNHLINGITRNKNMSHRFYCDNVEIFFNNNLDIKCNEFKCVEEYDIMSVDSDEVIAKTKITYTFYDGINCLIESTLLELKDNIQFKDAMFCMAQTYTDNTKYYVPNMLGYERPLVLEKDKYFLNTEVINANSLKNKAVNISSNNAQSIGFLPFFNSSKENRDIFSTRKYLELRKQNEKIYMSCIDSVDINITNQGTLYNAISYKCHNEFKEDSNIYYVKYNDKYYLFIDIFSNTKKERVFEIPSFLKNKKIREIDNTYNSGYSINNNKITLFTDLATLCFEL